MSIWTQKSASIQLRTSRPKFANNVPTTSKVVSTARATAASAKIVRRGLEGDVVDLHDRQTIHEKIILKIIEMYTSKNTMTKNDDSKGENSIIIDVVCM